jgi:hypothetical protein
MNDLLVLPSTFLLTLLLLVGLFFFVKASVKDRTEQVDFIATQPEELLLPALQDYFQQRAYRVVAADAQREEITFEGVVRPSVFLAVLLTSMVAIALVCLGLVLSTLLPQIGLFSLGLVSLAPLATLFYWQKAQRPEQLSLKVRSLQPQEQNAPAHLSRLTVRAHRDELLALESSLNLERQD